MEKKFQTPLAKARGLGSAHHGASHWLAERVTSVALIPLTLWAVYSVVTLRGASYEEFTGWLALPWNAVLTVLLIGVGFWHGVMGGQVIAEDYISCRCLRMAKIIGMKLFFSALAVATIFAVLKVAL